MNRLIGIASAMLLSLLLLVPAAAAAEPWTWGSAEPLIIASGTDITLPADQAVDLFVVASGHARIEGEARTIFVVNGTADLVGAHARGIVAIQSQVTIDAASAVTGDIRTMDSTITSAPGAALGGQTRDLTTDLAVGWIGIGSVLFFIYIAFAVSLVALGVVAAGVAGRQIRAASALIKTEPLRVAAASVIGLVALITVAVVAMVTVVGIPFGIGLLLFVMPGLFLAGYIVVGVWLGELILARTSPGVIRKRPYLAAAIGLTIVGIVGILPFFSGLLSLVGFGAVVLLMWRVVRGDRGSVAAGGEVRRVAPVAG